MLYYNIGCQYDNLFLDGFFRNIYKRFHKKRVRLIKAILF